MWNICRTCMSKERTLISIFHQAKSPPINAMITAITSLEFSPNDTLPSQICVTCLETVEITYYFKEQALRCNNVLQQQAEISKLHVLQPGNEGEDETERKENYFYNDQKRYVTIDNFDEELSIENVTFNVDELQSKCSERHLMAISNDTFHPSSERDVKSFHLKMALNSGSRDQDLSEASSSNDSNDNHLHFEEKYIKSEEIDIEEHGVPLEGNSKIIRPRSANDLSLTALLASAESYPKNQDIQQYLNEKHEETRNASKGLPKPGTVKPHSDDITYKCTYCNKVFTKKASYKKHVYTHTRPHTCEVCEKPFSCANDLKKHMTLHTGEKHFECTHCNMRFTRGDHLKRHNRLHTGEGALKRHKCEVCEKKFSSPSHLKRHTLSHTQERPFKCQHCNADFSQKVDLNRHIRLHSGEAQPKPHKCDVCEKSFERPGILRRHMSSHAPENP